MTRSTRYITGAAGLAAIAILVWFLSQPEEPSPPAWVPPQLEMYDEAPLQEQAFGFTKRGKTQPSIGTANVLVLFAGFRGAESSLPTWVDDVFDADVPGSFAHYYETMSLGQFRIEGTVVPRRYTSKWGENSYTADTATELGGFGQFIQEILDKADRDVDFSEFDNNGPDGVPDSGDDDGEVDYLIVMIRDRPRNFIYGQADGFASLGFDDAYVTADTSAGGKPIRINGVTYRGAIAREFNFAQTMGVAVHEFGHGFGLPDLYHNGLKTAGIGKWGLMGAQGALGFGNNTPSPLSAWSREEVGWIGEGNDRLIEVRGDTTDLVIRDLYADGHIVKVPLRTHWISGTALFSEEYLLLEHRLRSSHRYNNSLPADGLLVWHVRPHGRRWPPVDNKIVDLVCADGLYADAGGRSPDPHFGRDNLDFWIGGDPSKMGDRSDPFDGVQFTQLSVETNPSTSFGAHPSKLHTGLTIGPIRQEGDAIVVDIRQPRWSGTIDDKTVWRGDIVIDGDLTIAPAGTLVVIGSTRVRFEGADKLRTGLDPNLCEIKVEGMLELRSDLFFRMIHSRTIYQRQGHRKKRVPMDLWPILFEPLTDGDSWAGIFPTESAEIQAEEESFELRGARYGLLQPGEMPQSGADVETVIEFEEAEDTVFSAEPDTFGLAANFPNPFDGSTTIRYSLDQPSGGATLHL